MKKSKTSDNKYPWPSHKEKRFMRFESSMGFGHAGERYLHIPEVPRCKVQVGLKWAVTNGE